MIAPLWSDVDTRGLTSGIVYYKLTNQHLIVQWDGVDYYDSDTTINPGHISQGQVHRNAADYGREFSAHNHPASI